MKVALLGNTCNNNFALLRYLLDLNIDAHLYLYSNEGKSHENPIHAPSWDSVDIKLYQKSISCLDIPNGLVSVIGRPDKLTLPLDLSNFSNELSEYDICVGSGLTPAIFRRMNKVLDIFYPYGVGIEWLADNECKKKLETLNLQWPLRKLLFYTQLDGLRKTRKVINWLPGITEDTLKKYSIPFSYLHIPAYYLESKPISGINERKHLDKTLLEKISNKQTFKIFSFMRHIWVFDKNKNDISTWPTCNKNNNLLIIGFKHFIDQNITRECKLFLSSWGDNVEDSKKLIAELNLQPYIEWIPLMPRSIITYILSEYADMAVGEFIISPGESWGSTAWECIAHGVPFMQSVNYKKHDFKNLWGYDLPPQILNVQNSDDVTRHISDIFNQSRNGKIKCPKNSIWFKEYNGHALAKEWIKLFNHIILQKNKV
tara:strand:- start:11566 stop:12849 length:1284 start_codon:yes stop_codon:yes gene_type:complete